MGSKFYKLGDCRNEELINEIFGSVTDFAQVVEEKGDEFIYGKIEVTYNEKLDRHTFYKKQLIMQDRKRKTRLT